MATNEKSYTISFGHEGYSEDIRTVEAASAEAALEDLEEECLDWLREGDWGEITKTAWIGGNYYAVAVDDEDEQAADTVVLQLDPPVPECSEDQHDWQAPLALVGGIAENPGVWGHGGGTISTMVCLHCYTARITDTWAQGIGASQGETSIEYEQWEREES